MNIAARAPRVAVIGGGITGLAAAHRLGELSPGAEVRLFEAADRLGGVLRTETVDGFQFEHSADNFLTQSPAGENLCRRVGIADDLLPTNAQHRRALVVSRGRLVEVPEGFVLMAPQRFGPIAATPILSLRAKLRLALEPFVPRRRETDDESLASFARRRLGRETYERLVQPLVSGIYTADPERLSIAAALPRFVEWEQKFGSLTRGALRAARAAPKPQQGARYNLFVAPRRGMSQLVEAVAAKLRTGSVELGARVESLSRDSDGRWRLVWHRSTGAAPPDELFDAAIVALPSQPAAEVLQGLDRPLADALRTIEGASCAVAVVGYAREQLSDSLNASGFVVPEVERRDILACSYSSQKFPGRAPEGFALLRVFMGGALHAQMVDCPEEDLRRIVSRELGELLGARGEPALFRVCRWRKAMPQYHQGHVARVVQIERRAAEHPGLALAGNAYRGVGVPQCIESAEEAAARIAAFF